MELLKYPTPKFTKTSKLPRSTILKITRPPPPPPCALSPRSQIFLYSVDRLLFLLVKEEAGRIPATVCALSNHFAARYHLGDGKCSLAHKKAVFKILSLVVIIASNRNHNKDNHNESSIVSDFRHISAPRCLIGFKCL